MGIIHGYSLLVMTFLFHRLWMLLTCAYNKWFNDSLIAHYHGYKFPRFSCTAHSHLLHSYWEALYGGAIINLRGCKQPIFTMTIATLSLNCFTSAVVRTAASLSPTVSVGGDEEFVMNKYTGRWTHVKRKSCESQDVSEGTNTRGLCVCQLHATVPSLNGEWEVTWHSLYSPVQSVLEMDRVIYCVTVCTRDETWDSEAASVSGRLFVET